MNKTTNNTLSLSSATFAAKRAAEIIFVLQNKERLAHTELVARLNETLREYGEKNADVTANIDELKNVTRKLHDVFASPDARTAAKCINTLLGMYTRKPRLSAHGNSLWHLHVDSNDHVPWAEWFAASSAFALAVLLAEKQQNPAGLCASPSCGRPFIDTGKGGGRSYCSPRCATRERVAAHRKTRRV